MKGLQKTGWLRMNATTSQIHNANCISSRQLSTKTKLKTQAETLYVYPKSRWSILRIMIQLIEWVCEGLNLDED